MERNKFIKFGVSVDEKESFQKYAKESKMSVSEFIRQAVHDKIRRIKHPEKFIISNTQFNPLILEQISRTTQKNLELSKLLHERQRNFDELVKTFDLIQLYSKGKNLITETETISNLLTAHKSLSPIEISEKTNIHEDIVIQILSNRNKFKLNIGSGKFSNR